MRGPVRALGLAAHFDARERVREVVPSHPEQAVVLRHEPKRLFELGVLVPSRAIVREVAVPAAVEQRTVSGVRRSSRIDIDGEWGLLKKI